MTTTFITSNIITSGAAFTLAAAGDDVYVAQGVTVASTGFNNGISSAFSASVNVNGSVVGNNGVQIGQAGSVSEITIGETGFVSNNLSRAIDVRGGLALVNRGQIESLGGLFAIVVQTLTSGDNAKIENFGSITATASNLGLIDTTLNVASTSEIFNAGTMSIDTGLAIFGRQGIDQITNIGLIKGDVRLEGGADLYDGRGGRLVGTVSGGVGNDTLYGGIGADKLDGGADSDTLYFDAEDLRFGSVLGGAGYDTGVNTDEATPLTINLGAQQLEGYFGSAADEVVIAGDLGGFGLFASTGAGNDLIEGTNVGDNINGGIGIDVLYGRGGLDDLAGGLGGDWVQGGAGADTFRYNALTDSTVNGQDFIADFSTADGDKINLTNALAGLAPATFNTGFGVGTSVYVFAGGGGTSLVQVYTGATLQMQIVVSQASLAATDFVL